MTVCSELDSTLLLSSYLSWSEVLTEDLTINRHSSHHDPKAFKSSPELEVLEREARPRDLAWLLVAWAAQSNSDLVLLSVCSEPDKPDNIALNIAALDTQTINDPVIKKIKFLLWYDNIIRMIEPDHCIVCCLA